MSAAQESAPVKLGRAEEVPLGGVKAFEISDGERVAVFQGEPGRFHALHDLCTHANARLSEGFFEDGCIACPWHGALFDIETGEALTPPAFVAVKCYPIEVREGELWLHVHGS